MESQNTPGVMWYNYPVEGILTANSTPVQVELGTVDIARQINQQVSLQYSGLGGLQGIQAGLTQAPVSQSAHTQAQAQVIVAHAAHAHTPVQDPLQSPSSPESHEASPPPRKSRDRKTFGERVPCPECGKTFSCNANLRDHMRLHTGERPFICAECGMSFAQRSNWRLHKRVHTGERPYMCGICGKTFARSSHLPGHMRVHTGERPYSCEECDNSFASAQALKNHVRTHTGEKPFVCEFCNTAFTHSSSLSSHKKRCTGEKRKRGRPLGSGRKSYRKKSTGRPRGRPRKKGRYQKRKRKEEIKIETNLEPMEASLNPIEADQAGLNSLDTAQTSLDPLEPDHAIIQGEPGLIVSSDHTGLIQTKQEMDEVPSVIVEAGNMTVIDGSTGGTVSTEYCSTGTGGEFSGEIIQSEMVQQHEAAVAMTALGGTINYITPNTHNTHSYY